MFNLTVNTSSLTGRILNIFFLSIQPRTTCDALWIALVLIPIWALELLGLLFSPMYAYAVIAKGTLRGFSVYVGENLSTLWFYPFDNIFDASFHSDLAGFVAAQVILALFILGGYCLIVCYCYFLRLYFKHCETDHTKGKGFILTVLSDFKNKVCRPIEWKG